MIESDLFMIESDLTHKRLRGFDEGEVLRLTFVNAEEGGSRKWMIVRVVVVGGKKCLESYGGWSNSSYSAVGDVKVEKDLLAIWVTKIPTGLANKILLDVNQKPRLFRIKESERILYEV